MEVTDDEGAMQWLMGIKYKVIVVDTGSPHYNYATFNEPCCLWNQGPNTSHSRPHTVVSNNTRQFQVSKFILYINVGGVNTTPKYV